MGQEVMKPIILAEGKFSKADIESLKQKQKIWQIRDIYRSQLVELFEVSYPSKKFTPTHQQDLNAFIDERVGSDADLVGTWVYFPWSGELVHMVGQEEYFKLRTNRNQNLINASEQQKLAEFTVGVTGLSVGGGMALALVYSGISDRIKLAEFDTLETCNLNRLRSGVQRIGQPKMQITLEQIYEINPFAEVAIYDQGLSKENLTEFVTGGPVPQVLFDEIDDFEMKIRLRLEAQKAGVPVVMLTSLGDSILVDIERYDQDRATPIFNGLLGSLPEEILTNPITEKEKIKYAMQIVGAQNIPTRALESLFEINKTLVGRPQLYSTIAVDGGIAAYLVKRLALGQSLPSGRFKLSFADAIGLDNDDYKGQEEILNKLRQMIE